MLPCEGAKAQSQEVPRRRKAPGPARPAAPSPAEAPATCVNLAARFGRDYKITHDPAARTRSQKRDPWMMQLPCRGEGVTIYPFGGDRLAVEVDGRPGLAKKLAGIPGVVLWQDGDGEKTFLFPVGRFTEVAAVVKPHRRRRLSAEQRAELAARLLAAKTSRRQALQAQ
jgi:hypothetical protein